MLNRTAVILKRHALVAKSLSNAFTSAFKELEPIPQYRATAKLAGFLQNLT